MIGSRNAGQRANLVVRLLVGLVFLPEGVKNFLFPMQWGAGRFARIGIPAPGLMAHFVGVVEIVCGALLLIGLATRLASVLLLVDMLVAIATTKIPLLWRATAVASKVGFWSMQAESRTDYAILMGLAFLALAGPGPISLDGRRGRREPAVACVAGSKENASGRTGRQSLTIRKARSNAHSIGPGSRGPRRSTSSSRSGSAY